jgi:ABC-type taurine transport system substrate-binding protein
MPISSITRRAILAGTALLIVAPGVQASDLKVTIGYQTVV